MSYDRVVRVGIGSAAPAWAGVAGAGLKRYYFKAQRLQVVHRATARASDSPFAHFLCMAARFELLRNAA